MVSKKKGVHGAVREREVLLLLLQRFDEPSPTEAGEGNMPRAGRNGCC